MKHFNTPLIILLHLILSSTAQSHSLNIDEPTGYGYHEKIGIPAAESIRLSEQNATRIVGGSVAELGTFYYQAGLIITLTTGWTSVCSGALIGPSQVLTSAHCWFDGRNQGRQMMIVLGSLTLYSGGTRSVTEDVVVHPTWSPGGGTHDIALAKMEPVGFDNNIYAVPLPTTADASDDFAGRLATVSGYGTTSDAQTISVSTAALHHTELLIISNSGCQLFGASVHGSQLCTQGAGAVGTCDGDEGGPLTLVTNSRRILVGISSYRVSSHCQDGSPSVFTRVTAFLPWILANM